MIRARVVKGVTDHFRLRFPEWMLTFILMQFGITLLRPGSTFDMSPAYATMRDIATEDTWGLAIVLVSGLRFAALFLNGTYGAFRRISPYVRAVTAGFSAFAWFTIAAGIFSSTSSISTGGWTYTGLTIADLILAVFVAGDAGDVEKAHRNGSNTRR